jgi:hypothetical protein
MVRDLATFGGSLYQSVIVSGSPPPVSFAGNENQESVATVLTTTDFAPAQTKRSLLTICSVMDNDHPATGVAEKESNAPTSQPRERLTIQP